MHGYPLRSEILSDKCVWRRIGYLAISSPL